MYRNIFEKLLQMHISFIFGALVLSSCARPVQSGTKTTNPTPSMFQTLTHTPCGSGESLCTATPGPAESLASMTSEPAGKSDTTPSTLYPTETSTPQKPAYKTPTPIALIPTPTMHWITDPNEYLGKLVKMEHTGDAIYLKDLQTGGVRKIQLDHLQFLGWAHDGCGLYLRMFDRNIVEVDLRGKTRRIVFDSSKWKERGYEKEAEWVELSPSEQWGAYIIGEGFRREYPVYEYHRKNEDLLVMSADGKQGPYMISQRRGAWLFGWSPDSTQIIYLDRDENGVHQLYMARYDGSQRVQITDFPANEFYISGFYWSPNGQYFRFNYEYPDYDYDIYLVRAKDGLLIDLGKYKDKEPYIIWEDDLLGIWGEQTIEWIEPVTGTLVRTDVVQRKKSLWFFGSQHLFYTYDQYNMWNLFLYDLATDTQELLTDPHVEDELDYWFAPASFPGERNCKLP